MSVNISEFINNCGTGFNLGNLFEVCCDGETKDKMFNSLITMLANYSTKNLALKKVSSCILSKRYK